MFLMFGSMGFTWVVTWLLVFKEIRIASLDSDDFMLLPPKVIDDEQEVLAVTSADLFCFNLLEFMFFYSDN